ncbi:PREDICTED: NF-kappa-B inhibitor cactus-like [Branchiostoma belcheri]|uniref:NF-kappa-B inhibitor cactus-like n=1 Tax=Branchiostoma belcheri TaxID=7741 RepID=A0A6P4ZND6_BRABE|nr:PREDICTED: NF-kappa-B inhibitor cactus-like [Branchiostoma belcheri]
MSVVQLLIDNGADLTSQKHGLTPLHLAAEDKPLDIVKMLVEAGADIRAEALKTGLTPLDMAKHTKKQDVVDYLVARAEKDNEEGGRPKRDPPSVEPRQTDTPVEETVEGAVGGIQKLDIKDEDSSDDDL